MRIGVMSDIHSNVLAFKASAEELEASGCDEYFLLGDYVSDTPYTRETLDFLYEFIDTHKCHVIRGNREEYMLNQRKAIREGRTDEIWIRNSASGNLLHAYEQLRDRDFDFFERLPITFTYTQEGLPPITCCHGSPTNVRELLFPDGANTEEWTTKVPTDYLLSAHTHYPCIVKFGDKSFFNSGCVGIAIDEVGIAQCLMLEDDYEGGQHIWKATQLHVPYDNKQVIEDVYKSGLMASGKWFVNHNVHTLTTGIDKIIEFNRLIHNLAEQEGAPHVWPHIDERFYEQATRQLGIPDYRRL